VSDQTPILLTGYDAKRCARRIHNEWDPSIEKVEWQVPADLQVRFDAGIAFEDAVFVELRASLRDDQYVDLSAIRAKPAAIAGTLAAVDRGVLLVMGGWLPDDETGGRSGRPDLLLRVDDGRYVPGDVKAHRMVARRARGTLSYSLPEAPTDRLRAPGFAAESTGRFDDYLQLAHYWRMLEAIDRAPNDRATGFIIGTDALTDLTPGGRVLTWLDLEGQLFETYSRSRGTAKRSALERYDHEQGFRLKVAATAANGDPALVQPIFTNECDSCPWLDFCRNLTGDEVASAQITSGRLSIREWSALADAGVLNVDDLADLDPASTAFTETYLPEVTHVRDPIGRLRTAIRRARMSRAGIIIERKTTGPIAVPRADIEIDFDIEWDPDDRVYLWGALVSRAGVEPECHPVVSWEELDDAGTLELAREFVGWLRDQVAAAESSGRSLLVYHYSNPEPAYLRRLLGDDQVGDLLALFVDLLPIIREHYFGLHGLGIKKVAPAFGFEWRDDDPGGLQSQLWLLEARAAQDEATRLAGQRRILAYNEDDVRATAAIRDGLVTG
jgi:predicted RecB family nuclease